MVDHSTIIHRAMMRHFLKTHSEETAQAAASKNAIDAEEQVAAQHTQCTKAPRLKSYTRKNSGRTRQYYNMALEIIDGWNNRRKHGLNDTRKKLDAFNTYCHDHHVADITEDWLKTNFSTQENVAAFRRKLLRLKERGNNIVSLRALL